MPAARRGAARADPLDRGECVIRRDSVQRHRTFSFRYIVKRSSRTVFVPLSQNRKWYRLHARSQGARTLSLPTTRAGPPSSRAPAISGAILPAAGPGKRRLHVRTGEPAHAEGLLVLSVTTD